VEVELESRRLSEAPSNFGAPRWSDICGATWFGSGVGEKDRSQNPGDKDVGPCFILRTKEQRSESYGEKVER
jgi:hypothetical protein